MLRKVGYALFSLVLPLCLIAGIGALSMLSGKEGPLPLPPAWLVFIAVFVFPVFALGHIIYRLLIRQDERAKKNQ